MFEAIVRFSVKRKAFVGFAVLLLLAVGIYSMVTLPVDAVPDITNNQVQIVTISPTLAPQEVEQLITFPIEIAMSNIMNVIEIRSVSRFGLSLVTVVFKENVPTLDARQLINEQIQVVAAEIPPELGTPEMMPITTGLGEIYQYTLEVEPGYEDKYDAMELRTIQDWIVKRNLSGIPGIVEINSFGGFVKEYEVAINPNDLHALDITLSEVFDALNKNNSNTGGSYIEKRNRAYYIRSEGMVSSLKDIENIVITNRGGIPIHIHDVGTVRFGAPKRFGAMTKDGKGEVVGGIAMMLKGANANVVTAALEERVEMVQDILPEGVRIEPYLNRSELVNRNISTVIYNLIEGAIIVFIILMLFLGNVRAGMIVASVIPLSLLFGFIMMRIFGVSANLMSLGAIDFGIVVDGSIVIVEGILAHLYTKEFGNRTLTKREMDEEVVKGTAGVVRSATFAVLIILIVFFPILSLQGIEGKYFSPMAKTLMFCIVGALILSLTYVPMMSSLFLKHKINLKPTFADRFFKWLNKWYQVALKFCLRFKWATLGVVFALLFISLQIFGRLGGEFIPTLDEGDFAMQMTLPAGSSLSESIAISDSAQQILMSKFPEIKHVVAKIGTAEVPTDPMAVEDADIMIVMKPFKEWVSADSRAEMVDKMKHELDVIQGAEFNFSQPIQLRFNELMTGAKADIAIKLYGEDMQELYDKAHEVAEYIHEVPGASDVIVEQVMGLPQLVVKYDRDRIARYGINIEELNTIVRTAYAGEKAGIVFENERRFDLVVRLDHEEVKELDLNKLFVRTPDGIQIPVSEIAKIDYVQGPLQINRDATKRRIVIGVNVRDADIQQVVNQISEKIEANVELKPGYYFEYGGQFENLQNAISTLLVVIPIALLLILLLLFVVFKNITYTLVVFSTIPFSLIGGILALWVRGLPFSISAGVGFIALFGVAVLNGILMLNHFVALRNEHPHRLTIHKVIAHGTPHTLRPVFLTGLVASTGFVPMAIATSAGAEVQRPLATVVIGGLLVGTVLTLILIPILYDLVNSVPMAMRRMKVRRNNKIVAMLLLLGCASPLFSQQTVTLEQAIEMSLDKSLRLKSSELAIEQTKAMRGESWEFGPTTATYSQGQLNGPFHRDYEITVEQSFGNLLSPFYKNALLKQVSHSKTLERDMLEREIVGDVKSAWNYYLYAKSQLSLFEKQVDMAKQLQQVAESRYRAGEISQVEMMTAKSLAASMSNQYLDAIQVMQIASKRLNRVCYSPTDIIPADSALSLITLVGTKDNVGDLQKAYFHSVVAQSKASEKIEKSRFFPEISAGYQNQKINPDFNLQAWNIGVAFPILCTSQASRIKQARIATNMAQQDADEALLQLENRIKEIELTLESYAFRMDYYLNTSLPEGRELARVSMVQMMQQMIGLTEYIQNMNLYIDIEKNYLETLLSYNQLLLEYEYYMGNPKN